jgi:hypothetical protein
MAKKVSLVLGVVFVLVGLLGFVPNPLVGEGGFFHTDLVHNLVHLIIGIVLLVMMSKPAAGLTVKVVGIVYLVVAILGFLMVGSETGKLLGLIEVNGADNWLHLVLGVVIAVLGWTVCKGSSSSVSMNNGSMGNM